MCEFDAIITVCWSTYSVYYILQGALPKATKQRVLSVASINVRGESFQMECGGVVGSCTLCSFKAHGNVNYWTGRIAYLFNNAMRAFVCAKHRATNQQQQVCVYTCRKYCEDILC